MEKWKEIGRINNEHFSSEYAVLQVNFLSVLQVQVYMVQAYTILATGIFKLLPWDLLRLTSKYFQSTTHCEQI